MTLEQQVCSLELAKRLKELGVRQKGIWAWWWNSINIPQLSFKAAHADNAVVAFTVAELGEMLPECFGSAKTGDKENAFVCYKNTSSSLMESDDESIEMIYASTEADARAKTLIYLLENKLITL